MDSGDLLGRIARQIKSNLPESASSSEIPLPEFEMVEEFMLYLQQGIIDSDPSHLDVFFERWLAGKSAIHAAQIVGWVNSILVRISEISREELPMEEANQLAAQLLPILAYNNQYTTQNVLAKILDRIYEGQASLERLDKSKSNFVSIAAHELKTPLTLLEGYTSMLRAIIEQNNIFDEHIFMLLDGMDSGSRRLRQIINDMIDVSLIDNQLLSLNYQPNWLVKVFSKIDHVYQPALRSRSLALRINRFLGDETVSYFDAERVFQALSNLVSNAIKYTPDGGKIIIDGRKLDGFFEIMVIDDGIGIDPPDQTMIFDKFQRIGDVTVHSSGKTKFKGGGPGLGLPIAKGIIEAHGGRIWVESPGYDELACPGSTFHILLPSLEKPPGRTNELKRNPHLIQRAGPEH